MASAVSKTDPKPGKARRSGSRALAKETRTTLRTAKKAERSRRKASNDPADMGRLRQIRRAYQVTHEYDRPLPWLLLAAVVGTIGVALLIGFLTGHPWIWGLFGLSTALLAAMIVLVRRAKKATYKRYAGQAGSAEVALQMLPKKWISQPVIAATKHRDVVHRTIGPGGLVLIGEGEPGRVRQLLSSEARKHERVAYGVTVTTLVMGDREGQVPLAGLADRILKLPKALQPHQVTDLKQRLRALDAVRPPVAVPKGPMPTSPRQVKGARQAMRGR